MMSLKCQSEELGIDGKGTREPWNVGSRGRTGPDWGLEDPLAADGLQDGTGGEKCWSCDRPTVGRMKLN